VAPPYQWHPLAVFGDGDDVNAVGFQQSFEPVQLWYFAHTWRAPRCPKIEYDASPQVLFKALLVPVGVDKRQPGNRGGRVLGGIPAEHMIGPGAFSGFRIG